MLSTNKDQCFRYIVQDPPKPLTEEDIWFQIGHVHEQQKDVSASQLAAKDSHADGVIVRGRKARLPPRS